MCILHMPGHSHGLEVKVCNCCLSSSCFPGFRQGHLQVRGAREVPFVAERDLPRVGVEEKEKVNKPDLSSEDGVFL